MARLSTYLPDAADEPTRLLEGEAADTATADSDPIRVICPTFSRTAAIGPAPWPPRPDGARPQTGDRCLVAISDQGEPWVIAWEPS